jgi:long-chain acyl-CoA synthetase
MTRPHSWEASYPPGLRWDAPIPTGTLPALLDRAVAAYAARPALEFRGQRMTFAELGARVDRLARGLAALGLLPGDAVALLLPNSPAHPIAFFAVLRIGGRVVHLSPLDPARTIQRKLADSGARTLITANLPGVLPQALAARASGAVDRLIVAEDADWGPGGHDAAVPPGARTLRDLDGPDLELPAPEPQDVAVLQYTGGTTGAPRAAMLTHANLTAAVGIYDAWANGIGRAYVPTDRVMCVLPLFHIYALTAVLLRALANGTELLLRPRFDAATALDDIEHGRCTHFYGVPTLWIALVGHPGADRRDLSALKVASSGGAALPPDVGARFTALTGLHLAGGWGMTETSPAGTNLLPDRPQAPGEIGVPLPGIEMDVVALDDPGLVLPPGEIGELRIRGPNVTTGYWRRPDETEAAFIGDWFLTGDVGRMDEAGVFTIVDRKKDMIISGGFNVYPRSIEDAIHEHPDVREAAVIGVPDPYRGQAAKAFVILRDGAAPMGLDALRAFLADKLGRHEMPTALEVRESLPHTPVGKLAKRDLVAAEAGRMDAGAGG